MEKRKRVGMFTTDNIVAVLCAVPQSTGTYEDVAAIARDNGADMSHHTLAAWVTQGRRDELQRRSTAMARFSKMYRESVASNCGPETDRSRQLDKALFIMERRCECGNQKMITPDGQLAEQCQQCAELEQSPRGTRTRKRTAAAG